MGIYISNIEKPKDCDECWRKFKGFGMVDHDPEWGTFYCKLAKGFCVDPRTICPITEVPKHGRLIDGDKYLKEIKDRYKSAKEWLNEAENEQIYARAESSMITFAECSLTLQKMPTIIEAEDGI